VKKLINQNSLQINNQSLFHYQDDLQWLKISFIQKDYIENIKNIQEGSIDIVTCFEVVEHLSKPNHLLKQKFYVHSDPPQPVSILLKN